MRPITGIAICAIYSCQWAIVVGDTKRRHHSLGPSHDDAVHAHTNQTDNEHPVKKHSPEHGNAKHHNGKDQDKHRAHRKAGLISQKALLLQTLQDPVVNATPQPINTPVPTAAIQPPTPNANVQQSNQIAATPAPVVTDVNANNATKTETGSQNLPQNGVEKHDDSNSSTDFVCKYLWFFFQECNTTNKSGSENKDSGHNENSAASNQDLSPVVSSECNIYGTTVLSLSDFKDADDNGWILINESNMPRITHNKQVDLDKPTYLQLKNVICNAATYEGTIKLGVDSIGGFIIRGSDQNFIVFEMNTLSKTATLKRINGPYQDIIHDVACDQINSQFIQKVQITDTGYKGQIDILIDGKQVISVSAMPFRASGFFGLYISQGNATFGDISIVPLKE